MNNPGRTIRSVADDLGVNHETLRNWINAHRALPLPNTSSGLVRAVSVSGAVARVSALA
ncbi:transposase [Kitasatospora aureofaciens]|uniref:transposase n=1 Tax=Kitasatospora aureofaciens TaxID=1894 RepID=UPI0037CB3122